MVAKRIRGLHQCVCTCFKVQKSAASSQHFTGGSSSSAFPAIYLGFTIFGEIFAYATVFLVFFKNPTIQVVTFRLCGQRRILIKNTLYWN